jgi:hypothetical protein
MNRFRVPIARRFAITIAIVLALLGGAAGVGVAVALDGDSGPPPDLPAENPDLFWQNLTPEQRADVLSEFPPEDGVTTPGFSEQQLDAYLEQHAANPPDTPPEAGIFESDVLAREVEPFQAINYWREVTAAGTNQYSILTVFVGYERTTPEHGAAEVSANVIWPAGSSSTPEELVLYPASPGYAPLRVVSADGHLLSLALADDPSTVNLLFDVDSRTYLTPAAGDGGGAPPCTPCANGQNCPDVCTTGTSQAGTLRVWRRRR